MAFYLLDTNVASWLLDAKHKRHSDVLSFVNNAGGDSHIYISRVTVAEIQYGYKVYVNVDHTRKQAIEQRLKLFQIREIDRHTTEPYSDIRAALFQQFASKAKKGKATGRKPEELIDNTSGRELGIQENDLWIAAIAVQYNLLLVTQDKMKNIRQAIQTLFPQFKFISLPN